MLTTRTVRSRRPAASGAGRSLAHAALAFIAFLGVVFAHGGACAAVEMSEHVAYRAHLVESAAHGVDCLHRKLPPHHQHGTEQGCSAITPAGTPTMMMPAATSVPSPMSAGEAPSAQAGAARLPAPCLENLCVMRI
ncbi:hypothetical protein ACIBQ1_26230 [Nonomuraea sp. NPDC050153]|uniref:hypothetical protein n=1 Tax=Nonomuraea sp. NPDC050153 TaxID=3364359 RepID=UPI0037B5CD80